MSKGIFADKSHKPTQKEVFEAISSAKPLCDSLIRFIKIITKLKVNSSFMAKILAGH